MHKVLPSKIIRLKDVLLITGLSRSNIYSKLDVKSSRFDPNFPKKIHLGARAVGWLQVEVETWVYTMKEKSITVDS